MGSCVRNIRTKNYQNLITSFQVTVENVGNVFLRHSVFTSMTTLPKTANKTWKNNSLYRFESAGQRRTYILTYGLSVIS